MPKYLKQNELLKYNVKYIGFEPELNGTYYWVSNGVQNILYLNKKDTEILIKLS